MLIIVKQLPLKVGWLDAPLHSGILAKAISNSGPVIMKILTVHYENESELLVETAFHITAHLPHLYYIQ